MSRRTTIFAAGINPNTRAKDLAYEFERYGRLVRCDIPAPRPHAKPYAFVEFENARDAEDAYHEMHGLRVEGFTLNIQWARNAPSKSWRFERDERGGGRRRSRSRSRTPPRYYRRRSSRSRSRHRAPVSRSRSPPSHSRRASRSLSPETRDRRDSSVPPPAVTSEASLNGHDASSSAAAVVVPTTTAAATVAPPSPPPPPVEQTLSLPVEEPVKDNESPLRE